MIPQGPNAESPEPETSIRGGAVSRRAVLKQFALAITAAGTGGFSLEAARVVHEVALEARGQTGSYIPQALTEHEYATLSRLAELIVPADSGGGSGVDAGAPEFIDLLCSQNDDLAAIYHDGFAWVDATTRRRDGRAFVEATADQQTALLDTLVEAERADEAAGLAPGVAFFGWVRRMTVDAYYTSPIGIADIGYQGNSSMTSFEVPRDAVDFVNRRIDEL